MLGGVESIGPWDEPTPSTTFAMSSSVQYRLRPHATRGFDYQSQLRPLLLFCDQVAFDRRCESALRAERQIFERDVTRSFLNAPSDLLAVFEFRALRADQPKNHHLVLRDETERLERPRTRVVILQQEPVDVHCREKFFGDRIVATLGIPVTAAIAAAKMN